MLSLHIDTARTWRGGQNQVLLTVLGLRGLGHRTVLVVHPDGELRRRAAEGLDLMPLAPRTEMDLRAAWRFSRIVKDVKPQIVHAHDPHGIAIAAVALSMLQDQPPPLIASRRVDFPLKGNAFSRWKHRQVDCFVCASEFIRGLISAQGVPSERAITVHEGIDLAHVAAAPPLNAWAEFWLPRQAPLVGNVGALVPHKGQRHFVTAAHMVLQEVPDARFIIAGEGELRPALEKQIREHHLEKHVYLAGFRPDVLSLLKAFDVFVMSSVTEGLGTSLLDAMACARPVVASQTGGIPEVVLDGETGLLVPPRDEPALAGAIVRLLGDATMRARFGQAGLTRVREHFRAEQMVQKTVAVYERLVSGRTPAETPPPENRARR
ncbi:MAG: glycosyltransferase [Acidobacteria bacterium]|nr:glycosyltransferase [Acidobacteriota bacterium]